jgi:sulfoxide reductase heme-binding subunit YedZ
MAANEVQGGSVVQPGLPGSLSAGGVTGTGSVPPSAVPSASVPPASASKRTAPVKPVGAANAPAQRLFGLPLNVAKILLFAIGLLPAARWVLLGFTEGFGPNPSEFLTRSSGTWTLVCLLIALGITPLRQLTKQNMLARVRRMAGLFAFFYAFLHFTTYIWFDQFFDLKATVADIIERPFILLGFCAFVLLIPLAVTSTQGWMRRLGKRWGLLHRAVYLIGVLAIIHYWWHKSGKNDYHEVIWYAAVLAGLLAWRLLWPYVQAGRKVR